MYGFNVITNSLRLRLGGLADWLFGCWHRRTSFPITLGASVSVDGQPTTQAETYVVCVECGRRFAYDWTAMRITRQPTAWAGAERLQGRISERTV